MKEQGTRTYLKLTGWTEEEKEARRREQRRQSAARYRAEHRDEINEKKRIARKKQA